MINDVDYFCRGICAGNGYEEDEVLTLSRLSQEALELRDQENNFFLSKVNYDVFWGKVKLIGYTMQLRPEHMRLIAPHINIDFDRDLMAHQSNIPKQIL